MNISDAIQILRKHNISGASVLRITEGKVTEHELLDYVLNACDQFIAEREEYKRLLKAAVDDLNATVAKVYNSGLLCECCKWKSQTGECCCPGDGGCDTDYRWRYADEAKKLLNDEKINNVE